MAESKISSQAFYAAELRSERVCIFGVLGFLGVVAVVLTVRVFILHTTVFNSHVVSNLTLAAAIGLYEYVMLQMVDRALSANQEFPRILWISSTILETAVPAIGIAWLTTTGFESAYRPLASPATLLFFVFIILSILRLDPWICRLAGITAAVSYVAAAAYLGCIPPTPGRPAPVTQTDVSLYAIILLVSGFIAARWGARSARTSKPRCAKWKPAASSTAYSTICRPRERFNRRSCRRSPALLFHVIGKPLIPSGGQSGSNQLIF